MLHWEGGGRGGRASGAGGGWESGRRTDGRHLSGELYPAGGGSGGIAPSWPTRGIFGREGGARASGLRYLVGSGAWGTRAAADMGDRVSWVRSAGGRRWRRRRRRCGSSGERDLRARRRRRRRGVLPGHPRPGGGSVGHALSLQRGCAGCSVLGQPSGAQGGATGVGRTWSHVLLVWMVGSWLWRAWRRKPISLRGLVGFWRWA
jgi:hypothetical protein